MEVGIMRKSELEKVWKQLDKACEAIEKLQEEGVHDDDGILFSDIVSLKNNVEEEIHKRTRTKVFEG
jgi:hypothetical protein